MVQTSSSWVQLLLAIVLFGCNGPEDVARLPAAMAARMTGATVELNSSPPSLGVAEACHIGTGEQLRPPASYARSTYVGDTDDIWFGRLQGITTGPRGDVWTYDTDTDIVRRFSPDLQLQHEFGRQGDGPGEFDKRGWYGPQAMLEWGQLDWIQPGESSVVVFDGRRFQRFTRSGEFIGSVDARLSMSPPRRIFMRGDTVYHAAGGYFNQDHWALRATAGNSFAERAVYDLPAGRSLMSIGSDEALPVWTARGNCVVVTRGDSNEFDLIDLGSNTVERITVDLPEIEVREETAGEAAVRTSTGGRRGRHEPVALARIRDLALGPDGVLWIRPSRYMTDDDQWEVVRVDLTTGEQRTDTVPSFPQAFGADGIFYGTSRDENRVILLGAYSPTPN